jgi:hypothetical protein
VLFYSAESFVPKAKNTMQISCLAAFRQAIVIPVAKSGELREGKKGKK